MATLQDGIKEYKKLFPERDPLKEEWSLDFRRWFLEKNGYVMKDGKWVKESDGDA